MPHPRPLMAAIAAKEITVLIVGPLRVVASYLPRRR
jgi:hypothetical protein